MSNDLSIAYLTDTSLGQWGFMGVMTGAGALGAFLFTTVTPLLGAAFGVNYVAFAVMTTLVTEKLLERKLSCSERWIVMSVSMIPAGLVTIGIGSLLGLSFSLASVALIPIATVIALVILALSFLGAVFFTLLICDP